MSKKSVDVSITPSSGDVFKDLGISNPMTTRMTGFCKHYSKTWDDQKHHCALGLDPDLAKDGERWLPLHYLPCIPEARVTCPSKEPSP